MKFRKIIILSLLLSFPFLFGEFSYRKSAGAHPGSTGAPGDNTCAKSGCHTGAPVTYQDTTVNKLIFSSPDSTYMPGQTYTIVIKTENPGIQRFGFEFQALEDAGNIEAGTVVITDASRTHEVTHMVGSNFRTSATHSFPGAPALTPGYNEWTFDWTAPATNVGTITFYYATNSTNNNNAASGDLVYNNTFQITPGPGASINEFVDEQSVSAFYDESNNTVLISYNLKTDKKVDLRISDNLGRIVSSSQIANKGKGPQKDKISLKENASKGVYYVTLSVGEKAVTKKIVVR